MCPLIGFAHKLCEAGGAWFRHPETNKTWSNYTTCVNLDDFEVTKLRAFSITNHRRIKCWLQDEPVITELPFHYVQTSPFIGKAQPQSSAIRDEKPNTLSPLFRTLLSTAKPPPPAT